MAEQEQDNTTEDSSLQPLENVMATDYQDDSVLSTPEMSGCESDGVRTDQLESSSTDTSGDEHEVHDAAAELDEAALGEEEEEEDDKKDALATGWISKNKKIVWSPTYNETLRYIPAPKGLTPGPTHYAIARISDPISSFALLLTDEILEHVVAMTNVHGRRLKDWRDVDIDEVRAYVGLLVLSGVYRSRHESTLSLWSEKSGRSIFRATMSHNRFHEISRCLHFDDKKTRPRDDKLAAFRTVWEMWTERLPLLFNPDTDICVDEQLVPFRGKCSFRQYMPKKPAKYGIKIWATCDVKTSYAWRLQLYTGKADGKSEMNQGMRVVLDMTEGLKGHTVTCDNFFTSYALSEELLARKMALVGTIRQNKPEIPPNLLRIKSKEVFTSTFAFDKNHTLVSYIQRRGKNVLLLSTKHRSPTIGDNPKKKPIIIQDYNKCKGGVDNLDKVVGTYSCRRRTNRWPLALFHNVIDVSMYNAFVLWTSVEPNWLRQKSYRRRMFNEEVGEMLVTPHIKRRGHLPRASAAAGIVVNLQSAAPVAIGFSPSKSTRKRCEFCTHKKRKIDRTCYKCGKFTCKEHCVAICVCCCST